MRNTGATRRGTRLKPRKVASALGLSWLLLFGQTAPVLSNPVGGTVIAGAASIGGAGNTLTINQTTHTSIINWQQFSINSGELTKFLVPSSTSATLNRVLGGNPSAIYGSLQSNGTLFLINPSGIVVGPNGRIDTAGFLGSTLDVSNDEFLKGGDLHFTGTGGGIDNEGSIHGSSGDVYLIANHVSNGGSITAPQGNVGLAAGTDVLFQQAGDQHLFVQANNASTPRATGVSNSGTILAAAAELRAAGGNPYALAINNTGQIAATGYQKINGQVYLTSDIGGISNSGAIRATAPHRGGIIHLASTSGRIVNSGTLNASATAAGGQGGSVSLRSPQGSVVNTASGEIDAEGGEAGAGGDVDASGDSVQVLGVIDTLAQHGKTGMFTIDPATLLVAAPNSTDTIAPSGGDETGAQVDAMLATTDVTLNANNAVTINDAITWNSKSTLTLSTNDAGSTITINSAITGLNGGLTLDTAAASDAITTGSGGTIDVDSFILQNGSWTQNAATLPYFLAIDFELHGASTFLRVAGGNGTTSPYQITDMYGLQGLGSPSNSLLGANAELVSNLEEGSSFWNDNAGFVPIGTTANPYTGTFNGQKNTIENLYINRGASNDVGLFGVASGVLENVNLNDVDVTGNTNVGGLVGALGNDASGASGTGSVSNASVAGTVVGAGSYVGGLVGLNHGTLISTSYSGGGVTGGSFVGGLVGSSLSPINNSYSTASVAGSGGPVGGLVGENYVGGEVNNSYSSGVVTGGSEVGGLVGRNLNTISGSFWDVDTSGISSPTGGVGSGTNSGVTGDSTATLLQAGTYSNAGWNIGTDPTTNTWVIIDGFTRPLLGMEYSTTINNAHQLQLIDLNSTTLAATYTAANYLDLSGITDPSDVWGTSTTNGGGFVPIGNGSAFSGTFAGNEIGDLYIHTPSTSDVGLFSSLTGGAVIQGVTLDNVDITGNGEVGALAGVNNGASITNVMVTGGTITGSAPPNSGGDNIGGVIGTNNSGSLNVVSNAATINGPDNVGGIAGDNNGSISGASNSGAVNASGSSVGGLVGYDDTASTITDSYNTATVVANGVNVGGVAGYNRGVISDSYNSGAVSSIGAGAGSVGGLVGENDDISSSPALIENCYSVGAVTGTGGNSAGGLVGDNFGTITDSYSSGQISGSSQEGGLIGINFGTVSGSFWDTDTAGAGVVKGVGYDSNTGSPGVTGDPTSTLLNESTYSNAGWNIGTDLTSNTWVIFNGQTRPLLAMEYTTTITNGHQLQLIGLNSTTLAANYDLNSAVDLTGTSNPSDIWGTSITNGGGGFVPFGGYDLNTSFSGNFNGNYDAIDGLYINTPGSSSVGLFGYTSPSSTLQNIMLTNVNVTGDVYVGGLVGVSDSTLQNDSSSGTVTGTFYVGGLTGNEYGPISDCYTAGTVIGTGGGADIGGLSGLAQGGSIDSSYSTASVQAAGSSQVGGLLGENGATLTNVYSTGAVTGNTTVGGLVGNNGAYNGGSISNAYTTSSVTGSSQVGGFAGANSGTISNSFWDTQTAGSSVISGVGSDTTPNTTPGVTAATTSQLESQSYILANAPTTPTWDFTNIWTTNGGSTTPQLLDLPQVSIPTPPTNPGGTGTMDTLNGTAFTDSGVTDAANVTIDLLYQGTLLDSTTSSGSGAFSFSISSTDLTGGILLTDATDNGDTFYQANTPAGTIGGVDLYGSTLRVLADAASNTALGTAAGGLTGSGINYAVSGSHLTGASGVSMSVLSNYDVDGDITVSGAFTTAAATTLTGSPAATVTASSVSLAGTFNRTGAITFTSTTGNVALNNVGASSAPATAPGITLNAAGSALVENSFLNSSGAAFSATGTGDATAVSAAEDINGVEIDNSTINAAGGDISMSGQGGYDGADMLVGTGFLASSSTLETTGSGSITVLGVGSTGATLAIDRVFGADIDDSTLSVADGALSLTGNVNSGIAEGSLPGPNGVCGVFVGGGSTLEATGTSGITTALVGGGGAAGSIAITGNTSGSISQVSSASSDSDNIGVQIEDANTTVSVAGSTAGIVITGTGGAVTNNQTTSDSVGGYGSKGVEIYNGAVITAGGSAPITVTGTAGANTSLAGQNVGSSVGVEIEGNSEDAAPAVQVTSSAGAIHITGTAGSSANAGVGVVVLGQNGGTATITSGSGGITLMGTGGSGNPGADASAGVPAENDGVSILDGATIQSNSGNLNFSGTAGAGDPNDLAVAIQPFIGGDITTSASPVIQAGTGGLTVTSTLGGILIQGIGTSASPILAASATFNPAGNVTLTDSFLTASGGAITINGTGSSTDPVYTDGVNINASTLNAAGGAISLTGQGAYDATTQNAGLGIDISSSTLSTSGAGTLTLLGSGVVEAASINSTFQGVYLDNSLVTTGAGAISVTGRVNQGTAANSVAGLLVFDTIIEATQNGGSIALVGNTSGSTAQNIENEGVSIYNSGSNQLNGAPNQISTLDGDGVQITGTAGAVNLASSVTYSAPSYGVSLTSPVSTMGSAPITITGTAGTVTDLTSGDSIQAVGVDLFNSTLGTTSQAETISTVAGNISITGTGGSVDNSGFGIDIFGYAAAPINLHTTSGNIILNGTGGSGNPGTQEASATYEPNIGVVLGDGVNLTAAGTIRITGAGAANADGVEVASFQGYANATSSSDATPTSPTLTATAALTLISTSGALNIQPGVGGLSASTVSATTPVGTQSIIDHGTSPLSLTGGNFTVTNSGVNVSSASVGNLVIDSSGAISLGTISATDLTLDNSTASAITQSGALNLAELVITTSGNVTLANAGNNIATLGAIVHTGTLDIYTDPGLTLAAPITGSGPVLIQDIGGNLTLGPGAQIVDSGAGNNVTLVTNEAIVNNSSLGANVLQLSGDNYHLYANNPTQTNLAGIPVDFTQYSTTYPGSPTSSGNGVFYAVASTSTPPTNPTNPTPPTNPTNPGNPTSPGTPSNSSNPTNPTGGGSQLGDLSDLPGGSTPVLAAITPQSNTVAPQLPASNGPQLATTSATQLAPFEFSGNGVFSQTDSQSGGLADSSSNSGLIGLGDAAQLNNGELNNVTDPAASGVLDQALGLAVRNTLADALKAFGDSTEADITPSSDGSSADETLMDGGDVVEIGSDGVKSIPLSQAPKPLQNALGNGVLNGLQPGAGH